MINEEVVKDMVMFAIEGIDRVQRRRWGYVSFCVKMVGLCKDIRWMEDEKT